MKKATSIFFAFFYLLSSVGVAVNIHYCGGEVKDVAFYVDAQSCCDDDVPCDCCDDQTFLFQYLDEEVMAQSVLFNFNASVSKLELYFNDFLVEQVEEQNPFDHVDCFSPPAPELWLKYCALTLYG